MLSCDFELTPSQPVATHPTRILS